MPSIVFKNGKVLFAGGKVMFADDPCVCCEETFTCDEYYVGSPTCGIKIINIPAALSVTLGGITSDFTDPECETCDDLNATFSVPLYGLPCELSWLYESDPFCVGMILPGVGYVLAIAVSMSLGADVDPDNMRASLRVDVSLGATDATSSDLVRFQSPPYVFEVGSSDCEPLQEIDCVDLLNSIIALGFTPSQVVSGSVACQLASGTLTMSCSP